jgi:hypothetical protein
MQATFEPLFYEHGVDLVLSGHVHAYQRSHPVYMGAVTDGAPVSGFRGVGRFELAPSWCFFLGGGRFPEVLGRAAGVFPTDNLRTPTFFFFLE